MTPRVLEFTEGVTHRAYPDDETRLEQLARLLRECAAEVESEAPSTDE